MGQGQRGSPGIARAARTVLHDGGGFLSGYRTIALTRKRKNSETSRKQLHRIEMMCETLSGTFLKQR